MRTCSGAKGLREPVLDLLGKNAMKARQGSVFVPIARTNGYPATRLRRRRVHEGWRHAINMHRPHERLCINCISGRPGSEWSFRAEGPPAFSINILLEGRMQAAFDDGAVLDAQANSTILMATGQHAAGWDVLDDKPEGAFRMVSIHVPQAAMASLTGLQMDDLRRRMYTTAGEQRQAA